MSEEAAGRGGRSTCWPRAMWRVDVVPMTGGDGAARPARVVACFERVRAGFGSAGSTRGRERWGDRNARRTLSRSTCAIQVPRAVEEGSDGVQIRDLPGGRYAALAMPKDPLVIDPAITRFFTELVLTRRRSLDSSCPSYEIYSEARMEYCVPLS